MVSWSMFDGKHIRSETLLCDYPKMVERIEVLKSMLKTVCEMDEDAIIEQYTLGRKPLDGLPNITDHSKSKTEDLAIRMDWLRENEIGEGEATKRRIAEEIRILQLFVALYDIAMGELTENEKMLVYAHFQRGISLRRLAQGEGFSGIRFATQMTQYRLQKMRKDIIQRVDSVLGGEEHSRK